jgi:hypothetical protein
MDEEEQRGGVNWKRFDEDKLYRAVMTERGLPPPLPGAIKSTCRVFGLIGPIER